MKLSNPWNTMNARIEPDEALVRTFVASDFFWNRITTINEIVIGTSGSGKTAIMRMLSHRLLAKSEDPAARRIVDDRSFIGVYIPLLLFLGNTNDLNSLPADEQKKFFVQAFNYMACKAFITAIKSCIDQYFDPDEGSKKDNEISSYLCKLWLRSNAPEQSSATLDELHNTISQDWLTFQANYQEEYLTQRNEETVQFKSMMFFSPISTSIEAVLKMLKISGDATVAILLDEAEFLSEIQKREVNSLLRSEQRPFVFKIATLPFTHFNLNTINDQLPLRENQDFQFVLMDYINATDSYSTFKELASQVAIKRFSGTEYQQITNLQDVLGTFDYTENAITELRTYKTFEDLDKDFINSITHQRQIALYDERSKVGSKRDNKITNKYLPIFCVKKAKEIDAKGNYKIGWYSGFNLVLDLAEGNIRRFLNIMNQLFQKIEKHQSGFRVTSRNQHEILVEYSKREMQITRSLISERAYHFLENLCQSLSDYFYRRMMVESATSFKLDFLKLSDNTEMLIDFVSFNRMIPEEFSGVSILESKNVWRISYLLMLPYWVILRKGVPIGSPNPLGLVKNYSPTPVDESTLFEEGY